MTRSEPRPTPDPEPLLEQMPWVHALAVRLVGNDGAADDLAQEAALAALRRPPEGNLQAWFTRVLRYRRSTDRQRQRNRRAREAAVARREPLPSTAEVLERAEVQRQVVDAVFSLRDPYRTAVILRYFEALSTDEIARQQDISPETVRTRLHRAHELLRARLDESFGDRAAWCLALAPLVVAYQQAAMAGAVATATGSASTTVVTTGAVTSATTSSTLFTSTLWGGILMSTKSLVLAGLATVAVIGGGLLWMRDTGAPSSDTLNARTDPTASTRGDFSPGDSFSESNAIASADPQGGARTGTPAAASTDESPSATSAHPAGTGAVVGRVTQLDGQPLEGVVVHAVAGPGEEQGLGAEAASMPVFVEMSVSVPALDDPLHRAVTGRDGRYRIEHLAAGSHTVVVRARGLQQQSVRVSVALDAGHPTQADFVLAPGLSIEGIVLDARGQPVPDAEVATEPGVFSTDDGTLFTVRFSPGANHEPAVVATRTDAAGRFVLDGLGSGNQSLVARHPDHAPGRVDAVAAGSRDLEIHLPAGTRLAGVVTDTAGAPVVEARVHLPGGPARSGASTRTDEQGAFSLVHAGSGSVEIRVTAEGLVPLTQSIALRGGKDLLDLALVLQPGVLVRGTVIGVDGLPVGGAQVTAHRAERTPHGLLGAGVLQATTADDGRFELRGLIPGESYQAYVRHARLRELPIEPFLATPPEVQLGGLAMSPGAVVRGIVVSADDTPIAGARVALEEVHEEAEQEQQIAFAAQFSARLDGADGMGGKHAVTTGIDGRFELAGVAGGNYLLSARAPGHVTHLGEPRTIPEGAVLDGERVELDRGLSIAGRVTDAAGHPIAQAEVSVARVIFDMNSVRARTDADGSFVLEGLTDQDYILTAHASGFAEAFRQPVTPGDEPLTLQLEAAGSVVGVVRDQATQRPVPAFSVSLREGAQSILPSSRALLRSIASLTSGGDQHRFQDPTGEFRVADVNPGEYTLMVRAEGYVPFEAPVQVQAGQDLPVEVLLDRGGAIEGRIVDRDGLPIAGAAVRLAERARKTRGVAISMSVSFDGANGAVSRTTRIGGADEPRTDEEGRFVLDGLTPAESVTLLIEHPQFIEARTEPVTVRRGETSTVPTVTLVQGGRLLGTFRDTEGNPTAGADLLIFPLAADGTRGQPRIVLPESDGTYTQAGLAAGTYELVVSFWKSKGSESGGGVAFGANRDGPGERITLHEGQELRHDLLDR